MDLLGTLLLLAATLSMGMVAGAFVLYAHTIMPGLCATDDRTFVAAFAAIDRAILNPWFLGGGFLGALVLSLAAGVAHLSRPALPWIAAAVVLYGVAVVITFVVHLALNNALKAAFRDTPPDAAAVRATFDERRWRAWNLARAALATTAFALLAWGLVR